MTSTRQNRKEWAIVLIFVWVSVACTARSTPVPSPVTPKASVTTPLWTLPTMTSEEAAWSEVVKAAQKEGPLIMYSSNFIGDAAARVAEAFKDRYGINMEIMTGGGSSTTVERVRTESRMGTIVGDFIESGQGPARTLKDFGLTAPADLPVLKEQGVWALDPKSTDPDGHILYYSRITAQIIVNTRLVKSEEEPTSYYDLLEPRWKGRIVVADPALNSNVYLVLQTLMNRGLLKQDYVNRLGQQDLRLERGLNEVARTLATGDAALGLGVDFSTVSLVAEGVPLKALPMKEGNITWGAVVAIIRDSPHPNAARVFVNWLLSPEGAKIMAQALKYPSVRSDIPNPMLAALRFDGKVVSPTVEDSIRTNDSFNKKLWVPLLKKSK